MVQMCHYLLCTSAGVVDDKQKTGKDLQAQAACMNPYPANSAVIYKESCQRGRQMTFTHSYHREISVDGDFAIPFLFPPGTRRPTSLNLSVCWFVCGGVC